MPLNIKGTSGCCKSETVLKVENLIVQFYLHFCQNIFFSVMWTLVVMINKSFGGRINRKRVSFFLSLDGGGGVPNFPNPRVLFVGHIMLILFGFKKLIL